MIEKFEKRAKLAAEKLAKAAKKEAEKVRFFPVQIFAWKMRC